MVQCVVKTFKIQPLSHIQTYDPEVKLKVRAFTSLDSMCATLKVCNLVKGIPVLINGSPSVNIPPRTYYNDIGRGLFSISQ